MSGEYLTEEFILKRNRDIEKVRERYGFSRVYCLDLPPGQLGETPRGLLVEEIAETVKSFNPETVYLPFEGDVHSDHRVVFEACQSALKTFRAPGVRRILCYETLSETDQALHTLFAANVFEDISEYLLEKYEVMKIYVSEMGDFPFPRSEKAIEALAHLRGSQAGFTAAEAFMLMRERVL